MRYNITLATRPFELIAFDVQGASEAEAVAMAERRLMRKRPWLRPFEVGVAKIVEIGASPARRRRKVSSAPLADQRKN
jgi:hypothetical protein